MAHEIVMPKLGLTMTEGTVEEWKFREGDHVKKGDVLLSISTDKLDFKTGNEEDKYEYSLTIYSDGSANIHIQPMNRQAISYSGELDIKE